MGGGAGGWEVGKVVGSAVGKVGGQACGQLGSRAAGRAGGQADGSMEIGLIQLRLVGLSFAKMLVIVVSTF